MAPIRTCTTLHAVSVHSASQPEVLAAMFQPIEFGTTPADGFGAAAYEFCRSAKFCLSGSFGAFRGYLSSSRYLRGSNDQRRLSGLLPEDHDQGRAEAL